MRRVNQIVLGSVALLASASGALGSARTPSAASEADCRRFVQRFYDRYSRDARNQGSFEKEIEQRPSLFSSELLRALREDVAIQRKSPGELVGLEFDPFLNAQDVADRYEVRRVSRRGELYFATVYDYYKGQKPTDHTVVVELRRLHGRWVFVNFRYDKSSDRASSDDLLAILAKLKADRTKGKK